MSLLSSGMNPVGNNIDKNVKKLHTPDQIDELKSGSFYS